MLAIVIGLENSIKFSSLEKSRYSERIHFLGHACSCQNDNFSKKGKEISKMEWENRTN